MITLIYISAVIILASLALAYIKKFNDARERLVVVTDFLTYLDKEKKRLPNDIHFNYAKCWKKSLEIMKKQGYL